MVFPPWKIWEFISRIHHVFLCHPCVLCPSLCQILYIYSDSDVSRLDSLYFRRSPMMQHGGGDGQEDQDPGSFQRQSTLFDGKGASEEMSGELIILSSYGVVQEKSHVIVLPLPILT